MSVEHPKILVAEDNRVTARMQEYSLTSAGFQVTVCNVGTQAVEAVQQEKFDAIITDYQMPGACGEEVMQAARNSESNAETPLILCSAKGYELDISQLTTQYAPCTVITKPFSPAEIIELVTTLMHFPAGVAS